MSLISIFEEFRPYSRELAAFLMLNEHVYTYLGEQVAQGTITELERHYVLTNLLPLALSYKVVIPKVLIQKARTLASTDPNLFAETTQLMFAEPLTPLKRMIQAATYHFQQNWPGGTDHLDKYWYIIVGAIWFIVRLDEIETEKDHDDD